MRLSLASLVAFATLGAHVAFATLGAHEESALVSGMGTLSCSKLNEQLVPSQGYGQNELSVAVFSWVQGYLSALNIVGLMQTRKFADLKSISEDEQWSHVVKFCQRNPDGFVIDAAQEMAMTRLRFETAPPPPLTR
jgi:hypothetical protein